MRTTSALRFSMTAKWASEIASRLRRKFGWIRKRIEYQQSHCIWPRLSYKKSWLKRILCLRNGRERNQEDWCAAIWIWSLIRRRWSKRSSAASATTSLRYSELVQASSTCVFQSPSSKKSKHLSNLDHTFNPSLETCHTLPCCWKSSEVLMTTSSASSTAYSLWFQRVISVSVWWSLSTPFSEKLINAGSVDVLFISNKPAIIHPYLLFTSKDGGSLCLEVLALKSQRVDSTAPNAGATRSTI